MIPQLIPVLAGGAFSLDAYMDLRFDRDAYLLDGGKYSSFLDVPGASSPGGAGFAVAKRGGVYVPVAADNPIIGDDGLGVWEARTNGVRNPVMAGAVLGILGSGGAMPTNGAVINIPAGVAVTIVNEGEVNGKRYIDIDFSGSNTSGATAYPTFYFERNIGVVASAGQTWTGEFDIGVLAGSNPGFLVDLAEYTESGVYLIRSTGPTPAGASLARYSVQRTLTEASTGRVLNRLACTLPNGASCNVRFRIAAPNLKLGADINDPPILQTSGLAATRTASAPQISGINGPPVGAILAEWVQPIIQTTTRTYVWNVDDTGNDRLTLRASVGGGFSFVTADIGDGTALSSLGFNTPPAGTVVRGLLAYDTTSARAAFTFNGSDQTATRQLAASTIANAVIGLGQGGPLGNSGANTGQMNSALRRLIWLPYFPSEAERVALTT